MYLYECMIIQTPFFLLESVQEQLGEAERKGFRAAFGLALYTHR